MRKVLLTALLCVIIMCSCDKNNDSRYDDIPGVAPDEQGYAEVLKVKLSQETIVVPVGEQAKLSFTILPKNATNTEVEFLSDDLSIATVDEGGVISALKVGHVIITVTSKDNSEKKNLCLVNVVEK